MCAFLSNFHAALVPLPQGPPESDVEEYIEGLAESECEECSDSDQENL